MLASVDKGEDQGAPPAQAVVIQVDDSRLAVDRDAESERPAVAKCEAQPAPRRSDDEPADLVLDREGRLDSVPRMGQQDAQLGGVSRRP
jgi:hypothetical protein